MHIFQFRISATKRTTLPTTVARHLRPVTMTPRTGSRQAILNLLAFPWVMSPG